MQICQYFLANTFAKRKKCLIITLRIFLFYQPSPGCGGGGGGDGSTWQRTGAKRHHWRSSAEYFPVMFVVAKVHIFKWMLGVFRCGGGGGGKRTGIFNVMSGRRWIKFQHTCFSCRFNTGNAELCSVIQTVAVHKHHFKCTNSKTISNQRHNSNRGISFARQ